MLEYKVQRREWNTKFCIFKINTIQRPFHFIVQKSISDMFSMQSGSFASPFNETIDHTKTEGCEAHGTGTGNGSTEHWVSRIVAGL